MFVVEIGGGIRSGSVSLLADAVDFLGDAGNYGLSLAVLSMGLLWRARAALVKGLTMGSYGFFVLAKAAWNVMNGVTPEPLTMGVVAGLALAANVGVAAMLYVYREGDANMRSVWLCSRNDAIGNVAVLLAALGVLGLGHAWPDIAVACLMAGLSITGAVAVIRQARREIEIASRPADHNVNLGVKGALILESAVTCPQCGSTRHESMPTDACQVYYECLACKASLRPKPGDCCVFCSYGSIPCPPVQQKRSQQA